MVVFKDHFSRAAAQYRRFRPSYPDELCDFLSRLAPKQQCAVDCGTGTGQLAVAFATHFERVLGLDASHELLAMARPHPRVRYIHARAEESTLPSGSVDLLTVGSAIHWFDQERFHVEARRILVPRGVVAAFCYQLIRFEDGRLDREVERFYGTLASYWPEGSRHVHSEYRTLSWPYLEVETPPFEIRFPVDLDELIGYLGTWSAVQAYVQRHEANPLHQIREQLAEIWGDPERVRLAHLPLSVRVGLRE